MQSGGFLDRLLGPLLKTGLPLMKNELKLLAKSAFILSGLTAAASAAADVAIHQKMFGSVTITLLISNEEVNDIMKIVKPLKNHVY